MQPIKYFIKRNFIIGACMKVHRSLGAGFFGAVYEEALEEISNIPFLKEPLNWIYITIIEIKKTI
jgi:hypothetical protein